MTYNMNDKESFFRVFGIVPVRQFKIEPGYNQGPQLVNVDRHTSLDKKEKQRHDYKYTLQTMSEFLLQEQHAFILPCSCTCQS